MKKLVFYFLGCVVLCSSCKVYNQDIMFRLDKEFDETDLQQAVNQAESDYILQPNDYLSIKVFTNKGERIIDPNFELRIANQGGNNNQRNDYQYLVQLDSSVKLPIVGFQQLGGLSLRDAEAKLELAYNDLYVETFVKLKVENRRVVVMGSTGGQIINLENENMSLVEILALCGGLDYGAKAAKVRVIRGDLSQPEVYMVDLSTVSGMQKTIMDIEAGDVIYVEPWRREWLLGLKDFTPIFSVLTSVFSFIIVLQNINR